MFYAFNCFINWNRMIHVLLHVTTENYLTKKIKKINFSRYNCAVFSVAKKQFKVR